MNNNTKNEEEWAFNRRYSRFKVHIFFGGRRSPVTHHGNERNCTVAQIRFGHVTKVVLNREQGLKDCIDRIALCEKLYGPYQTAIIYDNRKTTTLEDGTVQKGREVMKYVCGQLVESEDPVLRESEKKVYAEVKHCIKNGIKGFELQPIEPIDFKKEVSKAFE